VWRDSDGPAERSRGASTGGSDPIAEIRYFDVSSSTVVTVSTPFSCGFTATLREAERLVRSYEHAIPNTSNGRSTSFSIASCPLIRALWIMFWSTRQSAQTDDGRLWKRLSWSLYHLFCECRSTIWRILFWGWHPFLQHGHQWVPIHRIKQVIAFDTTEPWPDSWFPAIFAFVEFALLVIHIFATSTEDDRFSD